MCISIQHSKIDYSHSFQTRPGGRPDPRSRFRVLTESPGRPSQFFFLKKNQNDAILVKNKNVNRLQSSFWPGLIGSTRQTTRSHRVFSSLIFSSTRSGFSSGSAGSQVDPPGWAEFQNYNYNCWLHDQTNNIPTKWENKMGPHFFLNDEMSQYSCCLVGHRVDHVGSAFDDFQTLKQSWHQNVQQRSCIFK